MKLIDVAGGTGNILNLTYLLRLEKSLFSFN